MLEKTVHLYTFPRFLLQGQLLSLVCSLGKLSHKACLATTRSALSVFCPFCVRRSWLFLFLRRWSRTKRSQDKTQPRKLRTAHCRAFSLYLLFSGMKERYGRGLNRSSILRSSHTLILIELDCDYAHILTAYPWTHGSSPSE